MKKWNGWNWWAVIREREINLWRLKKKSVVTVGCTENTPAILCAWFPVLEVKEEESQDLISSWSKAAKGVRNSSPALHSLHHKRWLWSFYLPRNTGSPPHSLACYSGWYCSVSQTKKIHTVLMPLTLRILETLAHSKQIWESSKCFMGTEIWAENGDQAGRTSAECIHASLTLEKSAASGRAYPKHNSAPRQNSTGNRFLSLYALRLWPTGKQVAPWIKSGLWNSQSTSFRKKGRSMGSKRIQRV